ERSRPDLLETHLGMGGDALAEPDDLLGPAIDGLVDAAPKLVLARPGSRHRRRLSRPGGGPDASPMLRGQLVGVRFHGCFLHVWGEHHRARGRVPYPPRAPTPGA